MWDRCDDVCHQQRVFFGKTKRQKAGLGCGGRCVVWSHLVMEVGTMLC